MMNEKTINEQYAYIRTLLEEKRLKEALMQLESLLWQCPDWDLRTRLEQLQTSYKYMLEYMKQGANDPERWNLYQKMVSDTWPQCRSQAHTPSFPGSSASHRGSSVRSVRRSHEGSKNHTRHKNTEFPPSAAPRMVQNPVRSQS